MQKKEDKMAIVCLAILVGLNVLSIIGWSQARMEAMQNKTDYEFCSAVLHDLEAK